MFTDTLLILQIRKVEYTMNYIGVADLHIKSKRPQYRCDDYFETVCGKFKQIIYQCNKHNADLIIAGDLFDSVSVGYKVLNTVFKLLKLLKGKCFVVAGQHDMAYHSHSLINTPLKTLIHARRVILLRRDKAYKNGDDYLYGCSFGEEPIVPKHKNGILVIHRSITPADPPFFLPDAISAVEAFDKYKNYSFIISGDFHLPFSMYDNKYSTTLVNCGPMMRQSVDQLKIKPTIWLIDKLGIKPIELKVEPSETVFAIKKIKQKEKALFSKSIGDLVESLKDSKNKPDPEKTVKLVMNEINVSDTTRNKVESIMGSVIDGQS